MTKIINLDNKSNQKNEDILVFEESKEPRMLHPKEYCGIDHKTEYKRDENGDPIASKFLTNTTLIIEPDNGFPEQDPNLPHESKYIPSTPTRTGEVKEQGTYKYRTENKLVWADAKSITEVAIQFDPDDMTIVVQGLEGERNTKDCKFVHQRFKLADLVKGQWFEQTVGNNYNSINYEEVHGKPEEN